ncbi:hypothetical protein Tco_1048119 [Tanacetum coccineum]
MDPPTYGSSGRSKIQIAMAYVLPGVLLVAAAMFGIIHIVATTRRYFFALLCVAALCGIIIGVLAVLALMKQEGNLPKLKFRFMIEGSGLDIRYAACGEFDSNNNRSITNTKQKQAELDILENPLPLETEVENSIPTPCKAVGPRIPPPSSRSKIVYISRPPFPRKKRVWISSSITYTTQNEFAY